MEGLGGRPKQSLSVRACVRVYVFALKSVARSSRSFKPPYLPQFLGKWVAGTRWKWSRTLKRSFKFFDPRTPSYKNFNFLKKNIGNFRKVWKTLFIGFRCVLDNWWSFEDRKCEPTPHLGGRGTWKKYFGVIKTRFYTWNGRFLGFLTPILRPF